MTEVRPRLKKSRKPQARSRPLRQAILDITAEYDRMTVRQLAYQLSARGFIAKEEKDFHRAGDAAVQLRLCGELPFDKIVDGHRSRRVVSQWDSVAELLEDANEAYRRDYWSGQESAVEIWCEKDALTGVIQPVCEAYGVTYVATRGYPSLTLLWETAQAILSRGKKTSVFYFGDHDASGHNISEKTAERLAELINRDALVEFNRVALWPEQIQKYRLPTRPGKNSDVRQKAFARKFGSGTSVELDALPPDVLERLVTASIRSCIEWGEWRRMMTVEKAERESVGRFAANWKRARG